MITNTIRTRLVRIGIGVAIGSFLASAYAVLVSVAHVASYGAWDNLHFAALAFISVGAGLGFLAGLVWACSPVSHARRVSSPGAQRSRETGIIAAHCDLRRTQSISL